MPFDNLEVHGLRGFATKQCLPLAIPCNNAPGSGLTVLVGPNNGGKSTIVEAFLAVSRNNDEVTFSEGKRNKSAEDRVRIKLSSQEGGWLSLETGLDDAPAASIAKISRHPPELRPPYVLPSRRYFEPFFNSGTQTRDTYVDHMPMPRYRGTSIDHFAFRLFTAHMNRSRFNEILGRVLPEVPTWTIEQSNQGQYYLKLNSLSSMHTSDGLGDGIVSLLFIVDSLYDSSPGNLIVIDEPELSLHPTIQRALFKVFLDYSRDRQLVIATHSPYFIPMAELGSGARIVRVHKRGGTCCISVLGTETACGISRHAENLNNPHVLGLDAREVFFLDERVILVEGQEDVIIYRKIMESHRESLGGDFYGWGVGGAENMKLTARMLNELGFQKVAGILDANRASVRNELTAEFPKYRFFVIPTEDVRSKRARPAREQVSGLTDPAGMLLSEHQEFVTRLFHDIAAYFAAEKH